MATATSLALVNSVEPQLAAQLDAAARLERAEALDFDHGLVLWSRPFVYGDDPDAREYIVHRWYTHHSDGTPARKGMAFHSGGYYLSRQIADEDYDERAERAGRQSEAVDAARAARS